jgi:hypothetical protein
MTTKKCCRFREESMKLTKSLWIAVPVLVGCLMVGVALANEAAKKAAEAAATPWLALVDRADYAGSWNQGSKMFKSLVTQQKWVDQMSAVRTPLGKLVSREVKSVEYTTTMPGAPDGEYVVIQYNTSFENKRSAVETVTPMKEKDGTWKVSGYFIL